jgi:hypothetical protein
VTGLSPIEQKLKSTFQKRIKKLKKLRRRMRMWNAAGMVCAIAASSPLVYFLFTGNMPPIVLDLPMYIAPEWAMVLSVIGVSLVGMLVFYTQYKRDKDKFDKIRSGAVSVLLSSDAVCECKWIQCSCKDNLIKEMSEKHDINLSF